MKNVLLIFFLLFPLLLEGQIITTVAGNGIPGDSGDSGPATAAAIYYPNFVILDSHDNYYFTEGQHHIVRKVSANGIITTIIGNGTAGFSGDGFAATSAELDFPEGIAIDAIGNIYVSDLHNNRIRKVNTTTGIISTFAGNGNGTYSGDSGAATLASINGPADIACDTSGNLYISDHLNNRIRKVDISGTITTYAGTGVAGFSGDGGTAETAKINAPGPITCDLYGNIFFSDNNNLRIRKIDAVTKKISTVAGNGSSGYSGDGGPATDAQFWLGIICVDAFDNLYIADENNQRIRKVDAVNGIVHTIVGTGFMGYSGDGGPATAAALYDPEGVAFDVCGNLYIADFANHRIRKVSFYPNCWPASVQNITTTHTINVYPNPAYNNLTLTLSKNGEGAYYRIISIVGNVMQQGNLKEGSNNIPIQSLPAGMYMLEITSSSWGRPGGAKTITKFIKQ